MKNPFYLPWWFFRARFLGRKAPLQTVLFISDQCNLRCKHCTVYAKARPIIKSYEQIRQELEYSYRLGSRFVDFEGGEPFLWREGEKDVNDLFDLAKKIGFFSVTVTTNAQKPFPICRADSVWVSMDGTGKYHDMIRGEGAFAKLEKNIAESGHKMLSVNMVLNALNYPDLARTMEYVKQSPYIRSISFNFHTPHERALPEQKKSESLQEMENKTNYDDVDLFIYDWELRKSIIDEIIAYKKKGYPIMNSVSGLKLMKHNKFSKQCWVSNFILPDGSRYTECPGKTEGICDDCGFCMAGEMHSVFTFKPDTIWAGMKLRM